MIVLVVLVLLPTISYILIENRHFQLYVANRVFNDLSEQLGVDVSIGEIDIDFFQRLKATNLLVKDQQNDTLFFIEEFGAQIDTFSFDARFIRFKQLHLNHFNFNAKRYADSTLNFQFLLDSLGGKPTNNATGNKWHIKVDEVKWARGYVDYTDRVKSIGRSKFALKKRFTANNFTGRVICNELSKDSVDIRFEKLAFAEKGGILLKELKGEFRYSDHGIALKSFRLLTSNSKIQLTNFTLVGDSLFSVPEYFSKAEVNADFNKSHISLVDLKGVMPNIDYSTDALSFTGKLDGTVESLNVKDISINSSDMLDCKFSGMLNGLPHWENTFLYINASRIYVNFDNLKAFTQRVNLDLKLDQKFLENVDFVKFNGNLSGYPDNLVAFGNFTTNLGEIASDLAIETFHNLDSISYKGAVSSSYFELGNLLQSNKHIGKIAFNISMNGYKLKNKSLAAVLRGSVDAYEYKNYLYRNIELNGFISDRKFNGSLSLKDANGIVKFNGKVDMSTALPEFDFSAYVYKLDPQKMNLVANFPAKVSFEVDANFKGNNIENLTGNTVIKRIVFEGNDSEYEIDSININAFVNDSVPNLVLDSEVVSGSLVGFYSAKSLLDKYAIYFKNAMPTLSALADTAKLPETNNFNFNLDIKDYSELGEMLDLPVVVYDDSRISGTINEADSIFDISASVLEMTYNDLTVEDMQLRLGNLRKQDAVKSYLRCGWLGKGNNGFSNILLRLDAENDSINYLVSWANAEARTNSALIKGVAGFNQAKTISDIEVGIKSLPSYLIINDSIWDMPIFTINVSDQKIEVDSLLLTHNGEYLLVDGVAGKAYTDSLRVKTHGVDLAYISNFFRFKRLSLDGIMSGNAIVLNALDRPIAMADFNIDTLTVNQQYQGDLNLKTTWDERGKLLAIRSLLAKGTIQPLKMSGIYNPTLNTFNLSVDMRKFRIDFLQPYLNSAIQNIRGLTTGHIDLKGEASKPYLEGYVFAQNTIGDVDYLKTSYSFTDTVFFEKNSIRFNNITLRDYKGNKGSLDGTIQHDGFRNMSYNLDIAVDNFNILDTSPKDNKLFYGKAFGSGSMHVSGYSKRIFLDVKVKTEEGTKIYIPLSDDESAGEYSFINFYNYGESAETIDIQNEQPSGVAVNLDLEATPDAEVQLIFDSKMGDIIKGFGSGDLNFTYDYNRDFKMFGEYKIQQGTYSFILRNVINKKFDIAEGSLVSWSGNPYGALIDLDAYYRTKASLYELMGEALSEEKRGSRVPVNCHMMLTGNLMSPAVTFDIELPTSNEETQSRVDNIINSEEEKSRQVISLLVLNSFYTPDQLRSAGSTEPASQSNAAWVTTSELLSNQLSHWLSQISQSFDVGFNYRPGTEITSDEVEVALSTQIFDNRVKINGNLGYRQEQQYTSNFVGDFDVDFRLNKSGTVLLRAYTHANDDILNETSPTTQGMGIIYREDFDKISDLRRKYKRLIRSIFKKDKRD